MKNEYNKVGLLGMSSGGFQSSLAANVDEVDFFITLMTGCQLGSIVWRGLVTKHVKRDISNKGIDEATLNKAWSITDQLVMGHNLKAKHVKLYLSLYDKVVPYEYQHKLWEVFGKREKEDLPCSHYSALFILNSISDDISNFVKAHYKGLLGEA
jgi:hypothetical protein